ncbi:MAG: hypothetical protein JSU63_17250, partial [Phycisphaerales bacterium]
CLPPRYSHLQRHFLAAKGAAVGELFLRPVLIECNIMPGYGTGFSRGQVGRSITGGAGCHL